jgi:DNA gyrase subunit B
MSEDYDTSQIQVISSPADVRKRPGMYFGSTTAAATEQFVYELVANVADCYLSGTATFVSVKIDAGKITVNDDGPGLPFDISSEINGVSVATKLLTVMHYSGSADGHAPHVHIRSSLGVGLAVLNFASSQLKIQSWRAGVLWQQEFQQGVPLTNPSIVDTSTSQRGTMIEITPDPEIFGGSQPRSNVVRWRLFETAHLVRGLEIRFQQERFHAPQGLVQLIPFMNFIDRSDPFLPPITMPPPFHLTVRSHDISIDAVAWGNIHSSQSSEVTQTYSWVNGGISAAGGSHVTGFMTALQQIQWQPAGLMINVTMFDPEFAGPTRTQLAVPKIAEIVSKALTDPLQQHLLSEKEINI